MACLFQKIVSFDKESYFCIETINIKLSFHSIIRFILNYN